MTSNAATDWEIAEAGVRALLRIAGDNPHREGLLATPARYVRAWAELTSAPGVPAELLATTFDDAGVVDQMVVVGPIEFSSVCEHHLLPFTGTAVIAYLPDIRGVVGLSKLPRLLEHYARRPQVQERMTAQVTAALDEYVTGLGSACVVQAVHSCATLRGVRKRTPMTTSSLTGGFRDNDVTRAEFLALAHTAR